VENTPENMRRWVKNPQAIKPGALMPDFYLDDQQIDQLADYLSSLR
jgi:cytochrome c oxidase subunit II